MNLREQLTALYDEAGTLTAGTVVTAATPEDHPLHDRFEWDDKVAGHQYRLVQAAALIRSVKISYNESDESLDVRAFVSIQRGDPPERVYTPVEEVRDDPLSRAILLREMERDWRLFKARYGHMAEFMQIDFPQTG